jgi:nucleoside-diphosphate-sugar epimerase
MIKNILVTGGAGYVGSVLVPKLLSRGFNVRVIDLMIYGETLPNHPNLKIFKGDIRDKILLKKSLENCHAVIHLACISNDPSFELDKKLGKAINLDAFKPLVMEAKNAGVTRFIYASSSSVYGLKKEQNVNEDMSLEPLTDYSKFKADCEKILLDFQSENFTTTTIRPATVCGFSPRQRLDLVVNILTNLAYNKKKITIFGGSQMRPNIHINDMTDLYVLLLGLPKAKIAGKIYNAGYENSTVLELGKIVQNVVGDEVELISSKTDDNRSYHISSEKIKSELNFQAKNTIKDAVSDLVSAFNNNLLANPLENELYYNIKRMNNINLK